jgi:hypothetical protein
LTEEQKEQIDDEQKEIIKDAVVECIIKRYTREEALIHIKDKLGVEVMIHDYNRIRGELKRELGTNLKHLQRDKYAYRREYFKRIEEIRLIQKKLWKLIDENQDKPDLQKSCLSELNQSTVTLGNLYESIRKLDQNDTLEQKDILEQKNDVPEEEKLEQTADASSTKAPLSPEIQVSPHKIAKYSSDGKPVMT